MVRHATQRLTDAQRLTGWVTQPGAPQLDKLLGRVVHTASESTGEFSCDNGLINRIHRATRWSQRSNLMGYLMDCPQRDERLGWFGDAMVSMEEAMFNFSLPLSHRQGDPVSVVTAFYYYKTLIVAKAARVLGRKAEADKYNVLAKEIKAAFNRKLYDPKKRQYEQGTQFSNAFPLVLGLADVSDESAVLDNILRDLEQRKGHFNVGVLGAKCLMDALTQSGRAAVVYQLATQTGYPSWAHLLGGDRTTLSEFWDLHGSHNHVMLGSIDGWLYRVLGGIQPQEAKPGFEHILIRPFVPSSLSSVRARIHTIRGPVAVEWTKQNGLLSMKITIPANSPVTVHVPATSASTVSSTRRLAKKRFESGAVSFLAGSGSYEFRVAAGKP